jgi:hypothetical protein
MNFEVDEEALKLINTYMDWFSEAVPFDELKIASLEEFKIFLRQAIVTNKPIRAS